MSAVSLAVMSYVGFGAIATLTQEAKDPKHGPSRAMMVMAILLCVLYALQCFIATCIDPSARPLPATLTTRSTPWPRWPPVPGS